MLTASDSRVGLLLTFTGRRPRRLRLRIVPLNITLFSATEVSPISITRTCLISYPNKDGLATYPRKGGSLLSAYGALSHNA